MSEQYGDHQECSRGGSGMSDDLVKRLTIKAGVMEMGEKIDWGSDTSLMREAADRIEELCLLHREYEKILTERIEELEQMLAKAVDDTLDAASAYLKMQYDVGALSHPIDRGRIIAQLKGEDRG
jgi:Rod binding domain-containing protein